MKWILHPIVTETTTEKMSIIVGEGVYTAVATS